MKKEAELDYRELKDFLHSMPSDISRLTTRNSAAMAAWFVVIE
jgi:hypothetical protein